MEFTSNNLTFVIVTFNSRKVIYDCLNSLPKDFHKLIIENSSDEELKKELEQNYDKTEVVLSKNIGMGLEIILELLDQEHNMYMC